MTAATAGAGRAPAKRGSLGMLRARADGGGVDLLLAGVIGVLVVVGLVMVLSSSSVQSLRSYGTSWLFFNRQVLYVALGTIALVVGARIDHRRLRALGPGLLALCVGMLVAVLVPGVGIRVYGSTRWLGAGPLRIQPSELAKFAVLLCIADLLARRADRMRDTRFTLRPALLITGIIAGLVMLQPDMGTTLVLGSIVVTTLFVAGAPMLSMCGLVLAAAGGAFVLGMAAPYRRERLLSFLDPWADAGNTGYQVVQSLIGMGSGQLAGVGLGASRAKWGFLPNAHTDFIFAIIGEELGLIGAVMVLALIATFAVLGVRAAMRAPDRFGALLAAGITAWVVAQSVINIGAVIGVLPVTGVPLPFVSYGGSSLVILMGACGILLDISRGGGEGPERVPRGRRRATT